MSPESETARMQRAAAVAANFNHLRGLIPLPMGVALLVVGALNLDGKSSLLALPCLALALLAGIPITRYYERNFGRVRTDDVVATTLVVVGAVTVFVALGLAVQYVLAQGGQIAVWLTGLQVAVTMSVMSWIPVVVRGRWRDLTLVRHWCAICALVVVIALVPVGLWTGGGHPLNSPDLAVTSLMWTFGAALVVGGALDHRLLVRTMRDARGA